MRRRQARPQALPWAAASMGRTCRPQSPQPCRGRPVPAGVRQPACVSEHALRALPVRMDPVLQRGGRTRRRCASSVNRWTRGARSSEGERDAGVGTRQGRCARGLPHRASRCRVQRAQPRRPRELPEERLSAEAPRPGLSMESPRLLPAGLRPRDSLARGVAGGGWTGSEGCGGPGRSEAGVIL